ncbi:MAG: glycosyltransferase, partial [Chthoniobacteraceae bacterium]
MPRTPFAICAFRRPDHLRALLASVAGCRRLDECAITIFCDGPRNESDTESVESARAVAREWAAEQGAEVVERAENLGLARSIVTATTDLVNAHGRVIVVEDDMILSPEFLDFVLTGLDRYENDERALQITGFQFAIEPHPKPDAFFIPL